MWSFPRYPLSCAPLSASPNNSGPERREFYCLSTHTAGVQTMLETGPGEGRLETPRWFKGAKSHPWLHGSQRTKSLSARKLLCVWKSSIPVIGCQFSRVTSPCRLYMAWCQCQVPGGCTEPSPCTSPQTGVPSLFQPALYVPFLKIPFRVHFPASQVSPLMWELLLAKNLWTREEKLKTRNNMNVLT